MTTDQRQLIEEGTATISLRAFAEAVSVTEGAIRRAIKEGRLTAVGYNSHGKPFLYEERALAEWAASHKMPSALPEVQSPAIDRANEEAKLTRARREKVELELAEMRGELHHSDDVRAVMSDMLAGFRARIRAIPSGVAPQLVGKDATTIMEMLTAATNEALQELAEYEPGKFRARSKRRKAIITTEDA